MLRENYYKRLFLLSSLLINFSIFSNEIDECLTSLPANFIEIENQNRLVFQNYINEYYNILELKSSTAITNVPAKIHIVTDSFGSSTISVDEILDEIDEANSFLSSAFLEITICDDINYIADNSLYNFDTSDQASLYANNQADIMNIYFVESISNGDSNYCGYTYLPGQNSQYYDVIVMDNQCTNDPISSTLIHEFGHHFNLIHTHGPSNSNLTDEWVNGGNCGYAGDRVCDTPADPQLNSSNVSSVNCMYTGNEIDAQGQFFDPDTSNIMSYSPNTCTDHISEQQFARMFAGYHTFKSYYKCPSFHIDFTTEKQETCNDNLVVNFSDLSIGATTWQWDVNGDDIIDYTEQNPSHQYSPGNYDVALTISNGSNSLTKVFPSLINFSSNFIETEKIILNLMIVDLNENSWEFKNEQNEILYSGGPYDQGGEYSYEFSIEESGCYNFTIYDTAGNGLNEYSVNNGKYEYYELLTEDGSTVHSNTDFGYEDSKVINTNSLNITQDYINNVYVYPNPTKNFLKIINTNILPNFYSIYDLNGRLIFLKTINQESDLIIDIRDLEEGMYFISIGFNQQLVRLKFFVR